ncbi:MAG: glycosyltransferase family 2 protein [Patescibacteria group bacterium]
MSKSIKRSDVWVILPAYNEARYIGTVLQKLQPITRNIVVIDDGSTDKTAHFAQQQTEHVLRHLVNLGKGAAMKTGAEYAFGHLHAKAVIFFDSDDQHNPQELELFYRQLNTGAQMILGVRSFDENMPLTRIIMNRLASVIILLLFGAYIPDIPSGFKAFTRQVYKKIRWDAADYAVEIEIAARIAKQQIPFVTVPIETIYHDLDRGMSFLHTVRMITKILSWRLAL